VEELPEKLVSHAGISGNNDPMMDCNGSLNQAIPLTLTAIAIPLDERIHRGDGGNWQVLSPPAVNGSGASDPKACRIAISLSTMSPMP